MRRNLESGRGLVFSGQLLLELTARGMRREDAYRIVQGHAMEAWKTEGDFRKRVSEDPEVRAVPEATARSPRSSASSATWPTWTRSSRGCSGPAWTPPVAGPRPAAGPASCSSASPILLGSRTWPRASSRFLSRRGLPARGPRAAHRDRRSTTGSRARAQAARHLRAVPGRRLRGASTALPLPERVAGPHRRACSSS